MGNENSTTHVIDNLTDKQAAIMDEAAHRFVIKKVTRQLNSMTRHANKLQQRLNRISNLTIGNERIWQLDEIANEFEITADMAKEEPDETDPDRETRNREIALFIRRLEWDLGEMHEAVRGATNRRGGRYDGANWKGVRP